MQEQLKTIIIDGQEFDISMFSEKVQKLTNIIMLWEKQLQDQRLEAAKTEAALREANREITAIVKAELKTPAQEETPAA